MKVTSKSGDVERRVLIGMITSDQVCAGLASRWKPPGLLASPQANTVASWCVKFYAKHSRAPGRNIETIYRTWANNGRDDDTARYFEKLLGLLSDEYQRGEEVNAPHLLDVAGEHAERVALESLADRIKDELAVGKLETARQLQQEYARPVLGPAAGVDSYSDEQGLLDAFSGVADPLVHYTQGLFHFFGDSLQREGFLAFVAPPKVGKTWWLVDLAHVAVLQKRRVAFFEIGDMSQRQLTVRLATRALARPSRFPEGVTEFPFAINWPVHLEPGDEEEATVTPEARTFDKLLDGPTAVRLMNKFRQRLDPDRSYFKLFHYPNLSVDVRQLKADLESCSREGWDADVVIIDYADLLAPLDGKMDFRHQVDRTWQHLSALRHERRCLVATATQANGEAIGQRTLTRKHISEDKRKLAHCTDMAGINQLPEEKAAGLYRLNWIARREADFDERKPCYVAGCLPLGRPAVLSCF